MYIPTQLHISRGEDDIDGGIAEINKVQISDNLPIEHHNAIMVGFIGFPAGRLWNYKDLLEKQEKLQAIYGENYAAPNPDINTPWIENGDIVNGNIYSGGDIW